MATPASMKSLFVRLGTTVATAAYIVDDQGYDEMDKLSEMTKTDVESFVKVIRSPGGMNADGTQNRGHSLTSIFQKRMHQAVFFIKTKRRVSRKVTPADIDVNTIATRLLNLRREKEAAYTNPVALKVEINKQDWAKTFSSFEQALGMIKGVDGTPLSYCMRKKETVTPEADDAPTNYTEDTSEMQARAPIVNAGPNGTGQSDTFIMDNPTVWDQVRFTFEQTDEWTHIRPFRATQDGRGAILKLRSVKMGTQYIQNQSGRIEKQLRELTWKGDSRQWKFEQYANKHQHYFTLLKELEGYREPNEGTRVRMLMDGIGTHQLDSAKNNILASDTLREDFDGAVQQFTNFLGSIPSSGTEARDNRRNASELGSEGGSKVQNRFYSPEEYKKLSKEDRTALYDLRKKAGGGGKDGTGRGKGKRPNPDKPSKEQNKLIKKQSRQIAKLKSQQSAAAAASDDEEEEASENEAETEVASNRTNQALRRRRGSRHTNRAAA